MVKTASLEAYCGNVWYTNISYRGSESRCCDCGINCFLCMYAVEREVGGREGGGWY